jgi:hypothetical protein
MFSSSPRPNLDFRAAASAGSCLTQQARKTVQVFRAKNEASKESHLRQQKAEEAMKAKTRRLNNANSSAKRDVPRLQAALQARPSSASAPFLEITIENFGANGRKKVITSLDQLLELLPKRQAELQQAGDAVEEDGKARGLAKAETNRLSVEVSASQTGLLTVGKRLDCMEQAMEPLKEQEKLLSTLWARVDELEADPEGLGREERDQALLEIEEVSAKAR